MDKNLKFIVRHYRKGMFAVEPALRRVKGRKFVWWTRTRIAAACAVGAILTASAVLFVHNGYLSERDQTIQDTEQATVPATRVVRIIDFEEAPLSDVVAKIKEIYGVEVTGLPADPDCYTLSLHYEGSAIDLVETINDILDTDMTVIE